MRSTLLLVFALARCSFLTTQSHLRKPLQKRARCDTFVVPTIDASIAGLFAWGAITSARESPQDPLAAGVGAVTTLLAVAWGVASTYGFTGLARCSKRNREFEARTAPASEDLPAY